MLKINKNLAVLCPQRKISLIELVLLSTNSFAIKDVFMNFESQHTKPQKIKHQSKVRSAAEKTAIKVKSWCFKLWF